MVAHAIYHHFVGLFWPSFPQRFFPFFLVQLEILCDFTNKRFTFYGIRAFGKWPKRGRTLKRNGKYQQITKQHFDFARSSRYLLACLWYKKAQFALIYHWRIMSTNFFYSLANWNKLFHKRNYGGQSRQCIDRYLCSLSISIKLISKK